ncbi:MAG: type IX secretion system sortase PorU [Pseudobacter sp.]|uniref:type IX secretion system sortase PorU n=1 Tax=Pseudobacter sp. TaxID=2045420 RepID=UPI003F7F99FA
MCRRFTILLCLVLLLIRSTSLLAQRSYAPHSVLASGNWFRIAVQAPGVYRLDIPFLQTLGLNIQGAASNSIRLYGYSGAMLPEDPGAARPDDLVENALWAEDGGDGVLNNNDYLLFYAPGPHHWTADPNNRSFRHTKNLYSEQSYYYLTIGGAGLRINSQPATGVANTTIQTYSDRYFYELDSVNLLSSGKDWFGYDFADVPGKLLMHNFTAALPGLTAAPATIRARCISRSFGNGSSFGFTLNGNSILNMSMPAVPAGQYDLFARSVGAEASFNPPGPNLAISITYSPGSANAQGWLDWFEITGRSSLSLAGRNQLLFRDWNSVAAGNTGEFIIDQGDVSTQVWDVTDPRQPIRLNGTVSGNTYRFINSCQQLKEYAAFRPAGLLTPVNAGRVANQDLHGTDPANMIILTDPSLTGQAQRIADFHQQRDGISSRIVTTVQVYAEFSSGIPDPVAVRDFLKMYYDRSNGDPAKRPAYLLLLGAGSFDYKDRITNNTNLVPAWESGVSLEPLGTYTSDDFFGFLDDGDDISQTGVHLLDIGIGRIPASNDQEAARYINKLIAYTSSKALGPWRNELTFVADDEDGNLHLQDAEVITQTVQTTNSLFNTDKIYLDAYPQESGAAGARYPAVNQAIGSRMFSGNLIWNYTGHGSNRRLAEEVVLDQDIVNSFNNADKLPLFITGTCDFGPYDNPLIGSLGEDLLLRDKTGAIALMTTTRLVQSFSNRIMNQNYLATALKQQPDGSYLRLGDAVMQAKNLTYTNNSDVINNRKFTLLGDPALRLAFPQHKVAVTQINGVQVDAVPDTLKALSEYTISGQVTDEAGVLLSNYNGTVYPVVFDKPQAKQTLGNDPGSPPVSFSTQQNMLFRGKARVSNGQFSFRFVVPRDINYQFGNGKISFYAEDGATDAGGAYKEIIVGGSGTGTGDKDGPHIRAWLNDEKFVNGGISNARPILLMRLADSSGINIMGTGIGHDLVAVLDNDQKQTYVLNQFYESETDNYKKGLVRFQLPELAPGPHTLSIKAWDAVNNSNEAVLEFRVVNESELRLEHVLNYPNPFTTNTNFWFDHNRPGEELSVTVQVYTVSGKLVKTLKRTIFSTGNRSSEVNWDGRDEYGSKIGRGVYIYRLQVKTSDGKMAYKLEKLYIL